MGNEANNSIVNFHVVINNINCKGIDVVDLVKYVLDKKCEAVQVYNNNGHSIVIADFLDTIHNYQAKMELVLEYDKTTIHEINQADNSLA